MAEHPLSPWRARYVRTATLDFRLRRRALRRVSSVLTASLRLSRTARHPRPQPQTPPRAPRCLLRSALALGTDRGSNEGRDRPNAGAVGNRYPHLRTPTRSARRRSPAVRTAPNRRATQFTRSPGGRLSIDRASRRPSRPCPPRRGLALVEPVRTIPTAATVAARLLTVPHLELVGEPCESTSTRRACPRVDAASSCRRPPGRVARPARPTPAACAQAPPPRPRPRPESDQRPC